MRRRLEARRLLQALASACPPARAILDVGCGDGFHLDLLASSAAAAGSSKASTSTSAPSPRPSAGSRCPPRHRRGLDLPAALYDAALLIQTIEHVGHPAEVLGAVGRLLKPGGRLLVVTDNTGSLDFRLASRRHWGGYHFPRHWYLFDDASLRLLAAQGRLDSVVARHDGEPGQLGVLGAQRARRLGRAEVVRRPVLAPVARGARRVHASSTPPTRRPGRGALLRVILQRPR